MRLVVAFLISCSFLYAVTAGKVWRVPTGGTHPGWGPVNLADGTNGVTGQLGRANLPSIGQQVGATSINFTTTSTSFASVTNATITITTTGRPVEISLASDGHTTATATLDVAGCAGDGYLRVKRGSTVVSVTRYGQATSAGLFIPSSSVRVFDTPAAGTYTYTAEMAVDSGCTAHLFNSKLFAHELMGN